MIAAYVLALRLGRWGIAGFGAVAFVFTLVQTVGFYKIAGRTEAERQAFGRSMSVLASQFTVIIPPPVRPDTVGGYVQWRAFGFLAILFAIWALASASGATRGDEERGIVQALLANGLLRPTMIAARITAFATGAIVAALAAGAGLLVGVASGGETFSTVLALEAAVAAAVLGVCCYSLTLLFAQLTSARNSTAFAGVILLALFLINSLSRTFDALVPWRWLSPFHYYEQSSPLVPGGTLDMRATLVLLGIAIAAAVLAALAFRYRDVGSPLITLPAATTRASYETSRSPVWQVPVVRDLYERRVSLLVWTAGLSALGAIFVVLTKSIVKPLLAIPELAPYFAIFINGNIYASFLGFIWFGFAQLLMAGFAITQVARWTAEDSDGRLELVLSNPISRARVVVERLIALALGALIIAAVSGAAVGLESHYQSIDLSSRRLAEASLLFVPFTLVFGTIGALLASRIPRATVGILGAFAFASYLTVQLGPIFKLPVWVQDISAFKLYGQPLSSGVDQTGLVVMLVIVIAGLMASAMVMERRDIGA
ncbi:MAG TPA: ABC transporter permease subunit [Candidatus Dormibacteraeota bacterium]